MAEKQIQNKKWFNLYLTEIENLIEDGKLALTYNEADKVASGQGWINRCLMLVDNYLRGIKVNIDKNPIYRSIETTNQRVFEYSDIDNNDILSINEQLKALAHVITLKKQETLTMEVKPNPVNLLINIFEKFHRVILLLESKNVINREGWKEPDYQSLLHPLLSVSFEDVRREEPNPSVGEGFTISDFYLKNEKISIELKIASKSLTGKKIRKQISDDKESYAKNSEYELLFFFIYQKDDVILNPLGFESDLSTDKVIVKVYPKS